jgi:GNAT superfamily N-acetyltransferase
MATHCSSFNRPEARFGVHCIRRAAADEALSVADVWLQARHAAFPAIPKPMHSDDEVRAFYSTVFPARDVWVVETGDALVAMLVLEDDWLDQLYVLPEWTGRGVGSELVELAKAQRPSGLQLWAFQSNVRALRFYERHGFVAVETTDGDNEEGAPDVRYVWSGR